MKLKALVAIGTTRVDDVCSDACRRILDEHFDVVWPTHDTVTIDDIRRELPGTAVLLTSWGTPNLDAILDEATDLRVIAHAAGTVKGLVSERVFERDIRVLSAAGRIADSVAEYCLSATLTLTRRLGAFDATMRAGDWTGSEARGRELRGRSVGILGASSTARAFLRLLAPFETAVEVYDPYLSEAAASALGVHLVPLESVMRNDIVSVHLPSTPETEGILTVEHLSLLPDGAVFVNSSRGGVVDQDALFAEIRAGRIFAALDVFTTEPTTIPADLRTAPNALFTPHVAGDTVDGHRALLEFVVRDAIGWLDHGEQPRSLVRAEAWRVSA